MNCSWSVAAGAGCCGGALRAGGGGGLREKRNGGRCDQENQSERAEQGPGGQAVHGGLHRVSEQSLTPRTNRCQLNIWVPSALALCEAESFLRHTRVGARIPVVLGLCVAC